ncbi:MAG: HEPN domain-containing protein, partial [Nitrososphaera sp.]
LEEGWYSSAVSRAYYALFQAARTALAHAGIDRPWWRHGTLQATFSTELVRHRKLYPSSFVHDLNDAVELRHLADYSDSQIPQRRARKVVRAAAEFVSRIREVTANA